VLGWGGVWVCVGGGGGWLGGGGVSCGWCGGGGGVTQMQFVLCFDLEVSDLLSVNALVFPVRRVWLRVGVPSSVVV